MRRSALPGRVPAVQRVTRYTVLFRSSKIQSVPLKHIYKTSKAISPALFQLFCFSADWNYSAAEMASFFVIL